MVDSGRPARWRFCRSGDLHRRLAARGLTLEVSPAALVHIARAGYEPVYGARPLRRDIVHAVETRIAVPTLLVLRGGEVAARQAGAAPVAELRRRLDDALAEPKPSEEKEPS